MRWFIVVLLVSAVVSSCGGGGGGDVGDVVEARDLDGGVNDPGMLSALDQELAAIDNREGLDDSIETVGGLFTEGLIDAGKRDELLDRLDRVESRLADDSDEEDHEQSELQAGDDECEASDRADEVRATDDVRVWDVIDEYRERDLCVNDPAVLAAFDAQIAVIDEPGDLTDVRDDVVTVFADGYIDAAKRDELLDRLSEAESWLQGESGTADTDEMASLQTDTDIAAASEPGSDSDDDAPTTQPAPDDTPATTTQPAPTPRASLASGIRLVPELSLAPTQQTHDRDTVPHPEMIVVSAPDASGNVTVTGKPGAVRYMRPESGPGPPWDFVLVTTVEWGTQDCPVIRADGSFQAQLLAPSGSTLYVMPVQEGNCTDIGLSDGPAAVLTVPQTTPGATPAGSFTALGRIKTGSEWTRWIATGFLTGPDPSVDLRFHDGPPGECFTPRIHLYRLFDGDGGYVTQVNVNIHGPVLTPTGLPIESSQGAEGYYDVLEFVDAPDCLRSDLVLTPADLPTTLERGWYLPRIMFGKTTPTSPLSFTQSENSPPTDGVSFMPNTGFGYLPMFGVGGPSQPRIPTTLLNTATSWGAAGSLGVASAEDDGRFALGSRRSGPGPLIVSPTDPLSGQQVHYTLEPYLPTIGYTGFGGPLPQALFGLDPDNGGLLSITLTTPDGAVRKLAEDADIHMFVAAAWEAVYPAPLSFSGPSHTIGLTTFVDDADVEFDQFGLHVVRVDGTLRSSRGDEFLLEGTHSFWVAEPLDLSLGVFEGTPLEVGDAWNPVVTVEPGVPADITIDIAYYPDGDITQRQDLAISGTANEFGYFASSETWRPTRHGEYRINVTATFVDPVDGTLWMGARSSASIVATPDTPLVAHGERQSGLADDDILRTWFFMRSLDENCGALDCSADGSADDNRDGHKYPFFNGDVAWITDLQPISPIITVSGPADVLSSVAPQLKPEVYCLSTRCVEASDTHLLYSSTIGGSGVHHRPDDVTSWAYWYSTSIRPDVSVFAAAAEGVGGEHNQWYGNDNYNCQIGLACQGFFYPSRGFRRGSNSDGDEEGDVKLLFGGAVLKSESEQHFVPYGSMGVIFEETTCTPDGNCTFGDDKGSRLCPPYQGAAGGLGTCGPLLTHRGRDVDLFITPTGTRPGSVLKPGDLFTFSGQAWPTLDVAVKVTVTGPDGEIHQFENRASTVGYVDAENMSFVVEESGVYEVHVSAIQDRPVPSTGLAPDPALVADGRTTQDVYGYDHPLSAVLGAEDSTYHFYVVDAAGGSPITSEVLMEYGPVGEAIREIDFLLSLPPAVGQAHYSLTAPGLVIRDEAVFTEDGAISIKLTQSELYDAGFTQIILGADTLQLSIAYRTETGWQARTLNQRGFSPLGG